MISRVGQRVVCIEDQWFVEYGETCPVKGPVYTVRGFSESPHGLVGLYLEEIVNPPHDYSRGFMEGSFDRDAFRPLIGRSTSIEIFKRMLAPKELEPV